MELWNGNMPYYDESIDFIPYLTPYIVEGAKLGVVVCPGGGYHHRAPHEGDDYAKWLNTIGVSAIVLEYRIAPYKAPAEGSDVQRAMRMARKVLSEHGAEKIGVMGSSAGGHLAATASVHYDKEFYPAQDEIDMFSARPDFTILCYPVIDFYEFRHDGSRNNLIGSVPKKSDKDFYAVQNHVTDDTPTAFLWHTATDPGVPAENSMLYAMALAAHQIPYELHIYPSGGHGQGLRSTNPYLGHLTDALERWLKDMM